MGKEKIKKLFILRIVALPAICIFIFGVFYSCGVLIFREINCRNFEFQEELKWYAGNINDVITFSDQENKTKEFVIDEKYLFHTTKYYSDTGCDCYDWWGISLVSGNDTLSMYGESNYIEKNSAKRRDYFYVKYNDVVSGSRDKSIETNYNIENKTFAQVLIYDYSRTESSQLKKIVIAPEIGIIELFEANGTIWRNTDLETKLNIDVNSFDYREGACE